MKRLAAWRAERRHARIWGEEAAKSEGNLSGIVPRQHVIVRHLPTRTLHKALARDPGPEARSAIQWELTRRQGRPALWVSLLALIVSVAAVVVSVWKD